MKILFTIQRFIIIEIICFSVYKKMVREIIYFHEFISLKHTFPESFEPYSLFPFSFTLSIHLLVTLKFVLQLSWNLNGLVSIA